MEARQITTCSGIGDFIWVAMKLINAGEKFHITLPGNAPQRGHQILDLLPSLVQSHNYGPEMKYRDIKQRNIQMTYQNWRAIARKESFVLSANDWLENGGKLLKWLPDLPISYRLPYQTTDTEVARATQLLPGFIEVETEKEVKETKNNAQGKNVETTRKVKQSTKETVKYIGIYTSAYSTQRNWGFWGAAEWLELIEYVYQPGIQFVIMGATWDGDLTRELIELMKQKEIPFIDTVGEPLPVVLEMQRLFSYAFYFPSGLPIMSETAGGSDCMMFYPPHLNKMINTYADPGRIESGEFKECGFCTPKQAADWVLNEYKLFNCI